MAQIVDIHLYSSVEELQKHAKVDVELVDKKNPKLILNSAERLFEQAEKYFLQGDEEYAYFYFFRYVDTISALKKKDEYQKNKGFYDKLVSNRKVSQAITKLEKLTDSLEKRYLLKKEIESRDSAAKNKEFQDALENEKSHQINKTPSSKGIGGGGSGKSTVATLNGVIKTNGASKSDKDAVLQNGGISPKELKNLLEQKTKRILLVDCRDKVDFTNNHIDHSNCISIPATLLTNGMSANLILSMLKDSSPESYMDWNKRDTFDYIILYDWNSNFDNRHQVLDVVYNSLTQWDQNCKNRNVKVIQGGMKNIYYTYPNLLTNPATASANAAKVNGSASDILDHRKLESISYPNLDEASPNTNSRQHNSDLKKNDVNVNNVPASNGSNHHVPSTSSDRMDVPKSSGGISVDRSTKPSGYSSSSHKIPNGFDSDSHQVIVNRPSEISSETDKTDQKVKEYARALDAMIESSQDAVKKEKEMDELKEMVERNQNQQLVTQLQDKQVEAEQLRKDLEKRNDEMKNLKIQYEAVLREQKSKQYLPKIRKPQEEQDITSKERENQKLNEMVAELRRMRKQKEAEEREEQSKNEDEGKTDSSAKLPPLSTTNSGSSIKSSCGTGNGITQLPAINNTVNKPSSNITPASRPVSQESKGITRQKLKDEGSEPPRSSSLKRSHSHPNIAQSHDEDMGDDLPASSNVPRINRGLKPANQRTQEIATTPRRFARNFEIVSSTERSKTGLKNLGNTCYMNSIIQCLSHTNELVHYLRNEFYLKEWHPSRSPTKGEATEELAAAVKQIHSGHRSISLLDLKSTIGKYHRSFRGYEQQDSHEFITILLDWLHEEMNRAPEKTPLKEQKNDGLSDAEGAARAWEDYKRSNDSKISELFCGQQKSCVTCGSCHRQSVTFEPFFILSVPIPSSGKRCDIQQCIDFYTTEEELGGWNCVHCKRKVRATKKIDLWRLPPYLIIHFQRFYYDGYWKKRLTEIDFPVDNLNLNPKVLGRDCNIIEKCPSYDYQLYGVSNHYGSMDGGHYTAYCRLNGPGSWWKFDDQEVCQINSRDVPTAAAYIMFYQNRNYLH